MKISELILILEGYKKEHGDTAVYYFDDCNSYSILTDNDIMFGGYKMEEVVYIG